MAKQRHTKSTAKAGLDSPSDFPPTCPRSYSVPSHQHFGYDAASLLPLLTPTLQPALRYATAETERYKLTRNVRINTADTCLDHAALLAITPAEPIPALYFALWYVNTSPVAKAKGASVVMSRRA